MLNLKFNVVVMGGGIGGYSAAIRLSQLGEKVLLVEKDKIGGECLNYACIPTKASIHVASLYHKVRKSEKCGVSALNINYDQKRFLSWRDRQIERLRKGIVMLCEKNNVQIMTGEASLMSKDKVKVKGEESSIIEARRIILATGSLPREIPQVNFDGERIIDTRKALFLNEVPDSLVIVGGGIAGVEIGQIYASLGSKVTMIEIMDQILPGFSRISTGIVLRSLRRIGVDVNLKSTVKRVKYVDGNVEVEFETPFGRRKTSGSYLLLAVGRKPNTQDLNLRSIGVKTDENGFIEVDENLETSIPGIYAVGDVTGHPMLAHRAMAHGIRVAESIAGIKSRIGEVIPQVVYSKPEIAKVGVNEESARTKNIKVTVGRFPFTASGRALTISEAEGYLEVVADGETNRVIGMEIVGPEASELISIGIMAVSCGIKLEELAELTFPHPTLSEAIIEASREALDKSIHAIKYR